MTKADLYMLLATGSWIWMVFFFAWGACVGSLTNVLVYRLPLGLSVVTPPSRCPQCGTQLTWRENIPIFGWLFLRGRCRFCKSRISPEYPLVELLVALAFAGLFAVWYALPAHVVWLGVDWAAMRPEWAVYDSLVSRAPGGTWPIFVVYLILVGSLIAMSLVDLKTFTIPLQIPWFATIVAVLFHVGFATYLHIRGSQLHPPLAPDWSWAIPTPRANWWWVGAPIGAMIGLGLANLFLHLGWMRRSFADYEEWEKQHLASELAAAASAGEPAASGEPTFPWVKRVFLFIAVTVAGVVLLGYAGYALRGVAGGRPWIGLAVGAFVAPLLAAAAVRTPKAKTAQSAGASIPADTWVQYPHARREMFKEILFLTPCLGLAWLGGTISSQLAAGTIPLWLDVFAGVLMGYLIGGGVVWGARLVGSIGFGKEAMGLGDVHLMAAVGACTGWIDAALALPIAAGVGLYWVLIHTIANRETPRAMQFGPYLAGATMLVILGKPLVEIGLTELMAIPPGMPPINLP